MFGNVRELKYTENFYTEGVDDEVLKTQKHQWVSGTRDWYSKLAKDFNADVKFSKMPDTFYA